MKRLASLLVIFCLSFTGCATLGPEYTRPEPDTAIPSGFLEAEGAATRPYTPSGNWWKEFGDPVLDRTVEKVLENNPDIRKAAASVMEAKALARRTRAGQYPSLDFTTDASRQRRYTENPITGDTESTTTDSFSLAMPASFELDLWGRLSSATRAARADLLAAEENRRTVVQSLIAEAVTRYFTIRSIETRLSITRKMTETFRENLELVRARYKRGLASILDVRQARRSLARSEARIPLLVQSAGKARQELAVLAGSYPTAEKTEPTGRNTYKIPPPIPAGLPSDLLHRRPDIRAAEDSLKAASERVGVAVADRFPRITLTGSFGYTSEELHLLLDPQSRLWKIASGLVQPIFDAGRLKAEQKAAEARYLQQEAGYAKTVLDAFREVESALLTRKQQTERLRRLRTLSDEAEATLETALDRYQRGLSGYINVLDAQQANFETRLDLVETRYNIFTNRVTLYRALGGGWDRMKTSNAPGRTGTGS